MNKLTSLMAKRNLVRGMLASLLAPILVAVFSASSVFAFDAEDDFRFATGLFRKQRWQYAADAFEKFLKDYPEHRRADVARLYYGLSLNSLEKYAPAREQFVTFVNENPESRNLADARYRIGECSYYLKEYTVAIPQLTDYLKKYEGHNLNSWALLMLGESYNATDAYEKAEAVLRPMVDAGPAADIVADSTFALAVSLQGQKKWEPAIEQFEVVAAANSPVFSHRSLARIGTIHFQNQAYAKASAAYDSLIQKYPDTSLIPAALLQSGIAQYRLGKFPEAISRLEKITADSDLRPHATMWKGLCRRELGELDLARTELVDAFAAAGDTPLAAEILFNRAQIEVLDGQKDVAAQMFVDLVTRWPEDSHVPDALFNAAELKMEQGDLATARQFVKQLTTDSPETAAQARVALLNGRLLLNEGKPDESVAVLQPIAAEAGLDDAQKLVRNYHLIRALHRARRFEDALRIYEPLHAAFTDPGASAFFGAIALASVSSLELQRYADTQKFSAAFLKLESDTQRHADALAARAVASAMLMQFDEARQDIDRLIKNFPENTQTWVAVLQSAESAWQQENFQAASQLFGLAIDRKEDPKLHLAALSGAAWSHYELGAFDQAVPLFRKAHETYPQLTAAIEAQYMEAAGLLEQKKEKEAADQFSRVFDSLNARVADEPELLKNEYFLDAGRMKARILGRSGDVAAADETWKAVADRFDKSPQLDEILDEWAYLNLQNEKYDRADEIYTQLLDRFPRSRFAGQARLSLAESQMQSNRLDVALREFVAIAENTDYADTEREAALYHAIDIHAAQRDWKEVIRLSESFAENYSASDLAHNVQLLYAEGQLDQKNYDVAREKLMTLREVILDGRLAAEAWTERIWVALAEVALAQQKYAEVDQIATELQDRSPMSRFLFQMRDVQGRRWKSQAEPDFEKSRLYFRKVIESELGRGTETAARCQFLIAETYLLQGDHDSALKEYYRVYLSYAYEEWRVRGLYQAAGCEVSLKQFDAAKRSYSDLIKDFPASDLAAKAKEKLKEISG